jgi:hypothetical protein
VDNSFASGISKRLDGWPNRDSKVGAIIALSPAVSAAEKAVFNSWGRGMYDPRHNVDGLNKPVVIPPAYGLGHHKITDTANGDFTCWSRYVLKPGVDSAVYPALVAGPRAPSSPRYCRATHGAGSRCTASNARHPKSSDVMSQGPASAPSTTTAASG